MVFLKLSDYKSKKQTTYNPKVKLPRQLKSHISDKKFLIECPTGCSQDRTKSHRLSSKKTFDTRNNHCSNCNFYKSDGKTEHQVLFFTGNGKAITHKQPRQI